MASLKNQADICLLLEGTYPYISGGVSRWTHELVSTHKEYSFFLVCILPPRANLTKKYELPSNVVGLSHIFLQKLPPGYSSLTTYQRKHLFESIEVPLLNLQHRATLKGFKSIIDILNDFREGLGANLLLNSEEAWHMVQRMYLSTMGEASFLNFFWSWRSLMSSFYSILLADLPQASIYHTLSTGYAGLLAARAYLETGRPCLITEHGIYTNERRIEITSAEWLEDLKAFNLNIEKPRFERDLKDFWIDTFVGYSKLCYEACSNIITLYKGNQELQIADGADPNKLSIIPNGIDFERLSHIKRSPSLFSRVALIGRVVPIKDVKTFIRAISLLKNRVPNLKAFILGPTEEDEDYYHECWDLVYNNNLQDCITFTGKVYINDYLGQIDLIVLTSISESQPLSILEGGAAGIPCIATDVGACREIITGTSSEYPHLKPGGLIAQLSNPESVAESIFRILTDRGFYQSCSQAMKERVERYYNQEHVNQAYQHIYQSLIDQGQESLNKR